MEITETRIKGLKLIIPKKFTDHRGYFAENFRADIFESHEIPIRFVQENESKSGYGTIRGLHYQYGEAVQGKLVRVAYGSIWDVAVDIRPQSKTYGQFFGILLSDENLKQLWIPAGFAHGFSVLSEEAVVQYKCDAYYAPDLEAGIRWNDPELKIQWRIPEGKEILSVKDRKHPDFNHHQPIFQE